MRRAIRHSRLFQQRHPFFFGHGLDLGDPFSTFRLLPSITALKVFEGGRIYTQERRSVPPRGRQLMDCRDGRCRRGSKRLKTGFVLSWVKYKIRPGTNVRLWILVPILMRCERRVGRMGPNRYTSIANEAVKSKTASRR